MKFLSEEWIGQYEPLAKSVFAPGRTPTAVSTEILEIYTDVDAASGKEVWLHYELQDGVMIDQSHGIGKDTAPRFCDFTFTIDSHLIQKLFRKEITMDNLLDSGAVDLKGSLLLMEPSMRTIIIMQELKAFMILPPVLRTLNMDGLNARMQNMRKEIVKYGGTVR